MPDSPPRALILTRQSVTGEKDVSLDSQLERCRAYCQERGYSVVSVSREESVKGWKDDREALAGALEMAANRSFDVLVAWDTSRVARSVRILEQLLHELDQFGTRFESVSEPWVGTPFVRQVLAAVAEEQTRTISRNVVAAKAAIARRGQWHAGSPPLGYQLAKVGDAPSILIPDEREAPLVREVFERAAAGETLGQIVRDFNDRGIRPRLAARWSTRVLGQVVHNPVYVGDLRYRGEIVAIDTHPPVVDREIWERANRTVDRQVPVRQANDHPSHWLEGHINHGCGNRMYLQTSRRPSYASGWQSKYYCATHASDGRNRKHPCTIPTIYLSAAKASWCARQCLMADLGNLRSLDAAITTATERAGGKAMADQRNQLIERRSMAERRYERARDAWLDGNEPREWLDAQRDRRDAAVSEIDLQLAALPVMPDQGAYRVAANVLREASTVVQGLAPADLIPVLSELGTVTVGDAVSIAYYPIYADFIPTPHRQPIPAGLPRSVTAAES